MGKVSRSLFQQQYADVFHGDDAWRAIDSGSGKTYAFDPASTYIQLPPFFEAEYGGNADDIKGAAILALLGDSVTTDHISPAGDPQKQSGSRLSARSWCSRQGLQLLRFTPRESRGDDARYLR